MTDIAGDTGTSELMGEADELDEDEHGEPKGRIAGPPGGASAIASLVLGFVAILGGGYSTLLLQWIVTKLQEHVTDPALTDKINTIGTASSGVIPALIALGLGLYARQRARTAWVSAAATGGVLVACYSLVVTAVTVAVTLADPVTQSSF
jgi:hypothetical protein